MQRHSPASLAGKTIDVHAHLGVGLKAYAAQEYPYAQTAEGLSCRQRAAGVDLNVVFPFGPDLHFDLAKLLAGKAEPAAAPVSPIPYGVENALLLREVYEYCPELSERFLPFLSADPGRDVPAQVEMLEELAGRHPVYGLKILPVTCQSPVTTLLAEGRPILEFARRRNLPLLLHTTVDPRETYSHARLAFEVIDENPDLRFCLAHCIGFDRDFLDLAAAMENVWFDTAALTIQVRLAEEGSPIMAPAERRFQSDYRDPLRVIRDLVKAYPDSVVWGTDSPSYAYICRRTQADGVEQEFRLKATYEDEVAALNALDADQRRRVSNVNTVRFVFGSDHPRTGD